MLRSNDSLGDLKITHFQNFYKTPATFARAPLSRSWFMLGSFLGIKLGYVRSFLGSFFGTVSEHLVWQLVGPFWGPILGPDRPKRGQVPKPCICKTLKTILLFQAFLGSKAVQDSLGRPRKAPKRHLKGSKTSKKKNIALWGVSV